MISVHAVPPVHHTFQFVGIHFCVDLNSMFRPVGMHIFFYGYKNTLRECLIEMIVDSERASSAIKDSQKKSELIQKN